MTASGNSSIYMGGDVRLTTLPNGAITNADARERLARSMYLEPTTDRIAPGVTVFGGDTFANLTLIEGDDGLIVYDTGEVRDDGERFLRQIRNISDKPVVGVLYSHSHYVHGTDVLADKDALIIGHPQVNPNLAAGATGATFAEVAPLQTSRLLQQFNHYVASSGPDAAAGADLRFGRSGMRPVNREAQNGEQMTLAGVDMQFFTQFGSDTDDCLTVFLPRHGVVLNNLLWPFMPNIYTLRGAKFRDPREWRDGLKLILGLDAEVLANTHARAIRGRAKVRETLEYVIDALDFVLDQTLRGILRGCGPEELREFVRLPASLAAHPNLAEIYGEVSHFGPYLYNHALGWFDGDAISVNPLPPVEQATRLIAAMGGKSAVLADARRAFDAHEYAWAAQLAAYLFRVAPADPDIRSLKADVLQSMGRVTPAVTIRSWYLSQARALRGEVRIPRLLFANPKTLATTDPATSIEQYRVRIDPERAGLIETMAAIRITDRDARHALHVRRGVASFVADVAQHARAPDLEIATNYDSWLRFFTCRQDLDRFLSTASFERGGKDEARAFFDLFDFYAAQNNDIMSPPGGARE
ncbi:MAG: alkyl sulfatase dimerization domain-containing protein [Rhodoblastus sp.]